MRDWIVGLQKGAIEHRAGVTADEWAAALREAGTEAPDELRDFFLQVNGATFASGVVIFPLRGTGEVKGVLEQSRTGAGGLPTRDVWRIGRRDQEHLAAIRSRRLAEIERAEAAPRPDWLEDVGEEDWVFIARDEATNNLRVYPSLELLLTTRIPPAHAEDFGEGTFARALSLVGDTLKDLSKAPKPRAKKTKRPAAKKPARKSATKAKSKRAPKRKPARTKTKAKTKKPAKKRQARRS